MAVEVTDVPDRSRFEARQDERLAGFVEYIGLGRSLLLTHTEVEDGFQGSGIGSSLVRQVLDRARADDRVVRPLCPFVAAWIRRHQDYADLVDPADQHRVRDTLDT